MVRLASSVVLALAVAAPALAIADWDAEYDARAADEQWEDLNAREVYDNLNQREPVAPVLLAVGGKLLTALNVAGTLGTVASLFKRPKPAPAARGFDEDVVEGISRRHVELAADIFVRSLLDEEFALSMRSVESMLDLD